MDIRRMPGAVRGRVTARLPSWRELAAQLGVARGTARIAYERLLDERFAVGLGAKGMRVAERLAPAPPTDNLILSDVATS
jgi:GntR family transcriptional regulator/MocR family aminotransferase